MTNPTTLAEDLWNLAGGIAILAAVVSIFILPAMFLLWVCMAIVAKLAGLSARRRHAQRTDTE